MRNFTQFFKWHLVLLVFLCFITEIKAQTLAFPGAKGFGRYATGARGAATRSVYLVTNLNDSGAGSFRDAVSAPGRVVVFKVGGIINLASDVVVSPNVTIAGQTAPGTGIVLFNKRVTFSGSNNTICRYLRIRLGATGNSGKDASGIANGANIIFDHMSITWGMDEVFSINWDNKGNNPDNITIQNSILGQGLHRENHSAGGLIQPSTGGKISLIGNLYTSNKTRNPKVKGINEFVNNVVYNWGNANRLGTTMDYGWSGEAYIMGGDSAGESFVNIINNYFIGGPSTKPTTTTPFSSGNANFNLYGSGNYFDNNKNGVLDGALVPYDLTGYPTGDVTSLKTTAYAYPMSSPTLTALQAYNKIVDSVGACLPVRDEVDAIMISDLQSKGTSGIYVYRETDLPLINGGIGVVNNGVPFADSDNDGMPDAWEDANGLNKNNSADAVVLHSSGYLNIERYVNSITGSTSTPAPATLTKQGAGSSSQTITLGNAITNFNYYWENATTVSVTGLPAGISASINNTERKVYFSGTPTATGVYNFTVNTVGGLGGSSDSKSGTITVNAALPATLTKQGAGSSSQTVTLGSAITNFNYYWENATTVSVTGLPAGVSSSINNTERKVYISGTPTATGSYPFTVTTVGGATTDTKSGTLTVNNPGSASAKNPLINNVLLVSDIKKSEMSIFPNPVNEVLNLFIPINTGSTNISIIDVNGKVLQSYKTSISGDNFTMQLGKLKKGIYILKAVNANEEKNFKFVK